MSPTFGMLKSTNERQSGRKHPEYVPPVRVAGASVNVAVLTMTFDQPIVLKGTPAYTTDVAGAAALSATSPTPTTVEITFDQDISLATEVNIEPNDAAVRNKLGGFVADLVWTI